MNVLSISNIAAASAAFGATTITASKSTSTSTNCTPTLAERVQNNDPTLGKVTIPSSANTIISNTVTPWSNYSSDAISSNEIEAIVVALGKNTHVEQLDLTIPKQRCINDYYNRNCNRLSFYSVTDDIYAQDFQECSLTEHCHVSNSTTNSKTNYDYIRTALKENKSIRKLCVSTISCTDAWVALCDGIIENTSIEEIIFGEIQYDETSLILLNYTVCAAIGKMLSNNCTKNNKKSHHPLKKISFRGFTIHDTNAIKVLASGLQYNRSITTFHLYQFESVAFDVLLSAINYTNIINFCMFECDIEFNIIDVDDSNYNSNNNMSVSNDQQDKKKNNNTVMQQHQQHPLTKFLQNNTKLIILKISDCILGPEEIPAICIGLQNNTSIKYVDLSGNDILGTMCQPIAQMLKHNTTIQHLILEDNTISDTGIAEICYNGLHYNSTLQKLNVRSNHITSVGCQALAHVLDSSKTNSAITSGSTSSSVCQLQSLFLSENELGNTGCQYISNMFMNNTSITMIELDGCCISSSGVEAIANGLIYNNILIELNLSNNTVGKVGCSSLSTMISHNKRLESIYLSSCLIDDIGLDTLVHSLSYGSNNTLKELWLSFNTFTDIGMKSLGTMIQNCSNKNRIRTIGIQFNNFTEVGLQHIVTSLENNVEIQDIFIWNGLQCTENGSVLVQQMDYYLNLNRTGRRLFCRNIATSSDNKLELVTTDKSNNNTTTTTDYTISENENDNDNHNDIVFDIVQPLLLQRATDIDSITGIHMNPPSILFHFVCEILPNLIII